MGDGTVKRSLLVSPLSIVLVLLVTVFAGGSLLSFDEPGQIDPVASVSTDQLSSGETIMEAACGSSNVTSLNCEEMEQTILSATLRIEIKTWIIYLENRGWSSLFSNGHGTVMDGRYLLTHNHFRLPLLELMADDISLYTADGSLLWQGPLTTAAVVYDDSETLLLEFVERNGQGLFQSLGIPSADFATGESPQASPGATVAQINWDSERAYVQWTQVEAVNREAGTPVVQLADCIIGGSSGGGIFLDGKHIANNWSRSRGCVEESADESQLYSKAALNSAELLAAGNIGSEQE